MKNALQKYLIPPKKERLPDTIAAQIKMLILSKKIAYGEKLPPERGLADMLHVSRVVVKQALMLLEQAGFIEIRRGPKGGAFITNQSYRPFSNSIKDLFQEGELKLKHFCDARTAVECCSVQFAAENATEEDFKKLKKIQKNFVAEKWDADKFSKHNRAFHVTIAEISGNLLIKSIILSLLEYFSEFWNERYPAIKNTEQFRQLAEDTCSHHQQILDALIDRDTERCVQLMAVDTGLHKIFEQLERVKKT